MNSVSTIQPPLSESRPAIWEATKERAIEAGVPDKYFKEQERLIYLVNRGGVMTLVFVEETSHAEKVRKAFEAVVANVLIGVF